MTTTKLRVGMIGTSWWADLAHLPLLKNDPRVDLVAICGRNRERAQEMADKYGIAMVYTDYGDMIAQAHLDAVVVSTPDDEHLPMTMTALDAGLHVLCEKPLAMNAADARTMYDSAESRNLRHLVFYTWRWQLHYRYMRELIDQGVIGRIFHAELSFLMGSGRNNEYQWRFDRSRANGVVGDSGAHMFDLARYLIGDIAAVCAHLKTNMQREGLNGQPLDPASDSATVLLEFTDGAHGLVNMSMVARVDDPFLEQTVAVHGEAGSLIASLKMMSGPELRLARGDGSFETLTIPDSYLVGLDAQQPYVASFVPMFVQQPVGCRLFIDSILNGQTAVPNFYEGWKAQQVIDAAIQSNETRCWVTIEHSE